MHTELLTAAEIKPQHDTEQSHRVLCVIQCEMYFCSHCNAVTMKEVTIRIETPPNL